MRGARSTARLPISRIDECTSLAANSSEKSSRRYIIRAVPATNSFRIVPPSVRARANARKMLGIYIRPLPWQSKRRAEEGRLYSERFDRFLPRFLLFVNFLRRRRRSAESGRRVTPLLIQSQRTDKIGG